MIEMPPARIGRQSASHDSSCWALNPDKESVCAAIHHGPQRSPCWWARSPALTAHPALHPTPRVGRMSSPRRLTPSSWRAPLRSRSATRSEEHTSELQSRLHLVCRLLLEKKKMN